jgi:hypothetical protein
MRTFEVTRKPRYEGSDSLHGSKEYAPDEFVILVDGEEIGGTYFGSYNVAQQVPGWGWDDGGKSGENWISYGPRGLSCGHRNREAAEQAQVREYAVNPDLSDRLRADERREREAEIARREAEWAEQDRRRRLGDDEPGPVIWTLPACHHLYAPVDEVRAVAAWLKENGIEDLSGWQDAHLEQRAARMALVYEAPTAFASLARGFGARGHALVDATETHAAAVTTMPPQVTVPPRPDLRPVFDEHHPAKFPLIDFGFEIACAACTKAAKAVIAEQMVTWPCDAVEAAISSPAQAAA